MGAAARRLTVSLGAWSAAHAALLAPAMAHDPTTGPDTLARLVEGRKAALFDVRVGGALVGAAVLRVECCERGAEGVIVAAAGRLPGVRLAREVLPILERQFIGVRWLRIHTARAGLVRELTTRQGYGIAETVLRKEITA